MTEPAPPRATIEGSVPVTAAYSTETAPPPPPPFEEVPPPWTSSVPAPFTPPVDVIQIEPPAPQPALVPAHAPTASTWPSTVTLAAVIRTMPPPAFDGGDPPPPPYSCVRATLPYTT